jgi:xyloglucan-specific exo-beta-1,4-glucanase
VIVTNMRRLLVIAWAASASALLANGGGHDDGQDYNWRNAEIVGGGYVPGIIFNQTEPGLVYARTDIGGAYRLNKHTNRWIPLLDSIGWDDWNWTGVDSLATDPVNPDRVYVLAGTYTNSYAPTNGAILRSKDRGRTWRRTDLPFKSGGNMPGRGMGERLAIDPNRNRVLYLGTRSGNGLWRSTDFGETFSKVTSFPAAGTFAPNPSDPNGYDSDLIGVVWVTFDPTSGSPGHASQTIYVGVADLGTSIYRSTDGGATWAALPGQPTGFMPHHGILASTGMLYITYNNRQGPYDGDRGEVWKYDTNAAVWTKINPDPSSSTSSWFGYGGLAVDAQHPDTLVVGELNRWWPDVNLWRSTNAGATWSSIWQWGAYPNRIFGYTQDISGAPWLTFGNSPSLPEVTPKLGWMVGDIDIDPFNSDRLMFGTGATIYGTDNLTNWDAGVPITVEVKAQGLEETSAQDLISPPEGAPLLSALGDIAGFRHDDLSVVPNSMYLNPTTGTTTSLDYAELSPNVIFRSGYGGSNAGYSSDGGSTWSPAASAGSGGTVALAADGTSVVWSTSGSGVFYSLDNGSSWTASSGIPGGARVASDRVNATKFYGFSGGTFYRSTDKGATFVATAATGLPTASAKVKAVPGRTGHIWLAGGNPDGAYGLWVSKNFGATFKKLTNVQQADNIGFGKAAHGESYPALYTSAKIHGQRGIFRSDDAGDSWDRINDDQHQYGYTGSAISGDPRVYGRVYVTTNGRGVIVGEPDRDHHGHGDDDDDDCHGHDHD